MTSWRRVADAIGFGASGPGGRRRRLAPARLLAYAGVLSIALGLVVALFPSDVSAAGLDICGTSLPVAPGSSGSCTYTVTWSGASSYSGPVDVSLDVSTKSNAASAPLGTGTEALLDGSSTGLQVSITDSAGRSFSVGAVSCYAGQPPSSPAAPPDAAYCESSAQNQPVATSKPKGYSDTFTETWRLPLASGNEYQSAGATVTMAAVLTQTSSGAVLGASTQQGGVQGASTPGTGAHLLNPLSPALVLLGVVMLTLGAWMWMRQSRRPAA